MNFALWCPEMNSPDEQQSTRTFWPYGLTIFIVLFMIVTLSVVVWLSRQRVDLVSDDYYGDAIAYQDQIDRLERTRNLPEPPVIMLTPDQQRLIVRLPGSHKGSEIDGQVHFYSPADSRLDRKVPLTPDSDGQQVIDLTRQTPGRWTAKLSWTVDELEYYDEFTFDLEAATP